MSEHVDKNKIWLGNTDVPPEAKATGQLALNERQKKEQELLKLSEQREKEAFAGKVAELKRQWEIFAADETVIKQVESHGIDWAEPGFIVEVFVANYPPSVSLLLPDDDVYDKVTPYAKIISASPLNDGKKGEWKPGDIIHLGDSMMNIRMNPNWEVYQQAIASNQKYMGKEPPKYIKKIVSYIIEGKLYTPDKAKYVLTNKFAILNEDTVRNFPGPFCFELNPFEVGTKRITGNPWGSMSLGQFWRNLKSRGLKDVTNLKTVKSFLDWQDIDKNGITLSADEITSYAEQVVYRRSKCPECVLARECVVCHCDIDGLILTPSTHCKGDKWGEMLSAEKWAERKQEQNTSFIVTGN